MKKVDNFSLYLSKFLKIYLPGQRNLSANTICSYRDTFMKLLVFCRDEKNMVPDKIKISQLSSELVENFLDHLENTGRCSISTRNQRLAAIKSFFRFIQVEEPDHLYQCQKIIGIANKKTEKPVIKYLTGDETSILLHQPDNTSVKGRRDLALLSLLYDSAARVQEICDVRMQDIRLDNTPVIRLYGKGRKIREVPLSSNCAEILRQYVAENRLNADGCMNSPLFSNSRREKLTRNGISYILKKYITKATEEGLIKGKADITPHCLRHSKAMHLVEAGVNLIYIRDFLGHESIETTQVYARANPEAKRKALRAVQDKSPVTGKGNWNQNPGVMEMLKSI